jgi:hypothetical protein
LLKIVEENIPACTKRSQNIYGRFNAGFCVLRILIIYNLVFQAMLVKLKQEGKEASIHNPPIEVDDIAIIYNSFNLDVSNDLQSKVFVDFMLFYCNRGRFFSIGFGRCQK